MSGAVVVDLKNLQQFSMNTTTWTATIGGGTLLADVTTMPAVALWPMEHVLRLVLAVIRRLEGWGPLQECGDPRLTMSGRFRLCSQILPLSGHQRLRTRTYFPLSRVQVLASGWLPSSKCKLNRNLARRSNTPIHLTLEQLLKRPRHSKTSNLLYRALGSVESLRVRSSYLN